MLCMLMDDSEDADAWGWLEREEVIDSAGSVLIDNLSGACWSALSPDGTKLATCWPGSKVCVIIRLIDQHQLCVLEGLEGSKLSQPIKFWWSPDGLHVACAHEQLRVFDGTNGSLLATLGDVHYYAYRAPSWSPDACSILTSALALPAISGTRFRPWHSCDFAPL